MKVPSKIKPFLITLSLCCASPLLQSLTAADPEPAAAPVAWHVENAELRAPVEVAVKDALLRMPPQVYIADLKPLEITGGLAFDPQTKDAIRRDVRKPEEKAATIAKLKELYRKENVEWGPEDYYQLDERDGGPIIRITGSATYAIEPGYKYFSWRTPARFYNHAKVYIDGKLVPEESLLQATWKAGEDRRQDKDCRLVRLAPIPPGAKTLKVEMLKGEEGRWSTKLRQAGFITRNPRVAHATICLPGHDPNKLVPVVHRASGERVGCRAVRAETGEVMSIMFDSSSGDEEYWVYLVDEAKQPAAPDWTPQAELVQEARQLDRYDPALETLAGFEKLWGSAVTVGRGVPQARPTRQGPAQPARVIYGSTLQFRPKGQAHLNLAELQGSQPTTLNRIGGTFQIPGTGVFRLFCMAGPGGYVLLDGQLIATFRGKFREGRLFEIEIDKGQHRLEILHYGPAGLPSFAGMWWKDPEKDLNGDYSRHWFKFGDTIDGQYQHLPPYMLWEPMADATTAPLESRSPGLLASFSWYQHAHLYAVFPGQDLNWYRFSAHAPGASTDAVYRWRFDDGRRAEGKQVMKLFLRAGMRKVQLEVLDAPGGKVVARAAGVVNVQLNLADWHNFSIEHDNRDRDGHLARMIWAFAEEDRLKQLPLDDLVNLYQWSFPLKHWDATSRLLYGDGIPNYTPAPLALRETIDRARGQIGDGLARRVDELIAAYPYSQLLQIAESFTRSVNGPTDARYAAAEELLAVVLERAPAGSSHWSASALALSDIKLSVRGDAEFAKALLEKFEQAEPAVDMGERWQFAEAREYHHLSDADQLAPLAAGLGWSPITRPRHWDRDHRLLVRFNNNRGVWLARDFDLPADWKGRQLVLKAGVPEARLAYVWINGEPLGRMWQWQDRNIVIPGKLLKRGGENRITWLLQPYPWPEQMRQSSPTVSADLSHAAYSHDHRIQLVKGRDSRRDLGQQMMVGVLYDSPRSLAFSPDGKQLASGHQYGSVRLWDVDGILEGKAGPKNPPNAANPRPTLGETHMISAGAVSIVSLAYSPDGKRLAAGSEDYRITILDPASGQAIRSLVGHAAEVVALAFSPDGKRLASASHDRTVKIWDPSSGKELLTLAGHAGPVHAVACSPDGKSIATAIDNAQIRLWDAATGKAQRTLDGQQGEVSSLAFSPDGKRLAAGDREGVVSQWDLDSGKKLMSVHHSGHAEADGKVTKVLYSLDGKELVSLGGGAAIRRNRDAGGEGEQFANFDIRHTPNAEWLGPQGGPDRLADGFESFPVELYTSEACEGVGLNYACYRGDESWNKLPDFDKLKPVKTGVLQRLGLREMERTLLPYQIKDENGRQVRQCSGMKLTGYLRVTAADDFEFSLRTADAGRLTIGSKVVIDSDGDHRHAEEKRGRIYLEPGVHALTIIYSHDASGDQTFQFSVPREFVRPLTRGEIDGNRLMAGTLLAQGKREEAKALLTRLHRGGWPLSDEEHETVEQVRMRIRRMSKTVSSNDHAYALDLIESSLVTYPMLRLDPEFMVSVIAVYASMGDPRAAILAEQMLGAEMNDGQRRLLIMTQVKIKLNAGDLPGAGQVYQELKKFAPQSDETIEARELIKAAVIKKQG